MEQDYNMAKFENARLLVNNVDYSITKAGNFFSPELDEPTIRLIPRCRNFFVIKKA